MTLIIIVNKMQHSAHRHSAQGRALLCYVTYAVSIMLSVIYKPFCAECRHTKQRYAECRSAVETTL